MNTRETCITQALDLAAKGYYLFPVIRGEKRPMYPGWQADSTTDPEAIRQWSDTDRFGIDCGKSRLVVIDQDPTEGGEIATLPVALDGPTVQTPRGGTHTYFRNDGPAVRLSAGKIAEGVDVRADGGLVVGPGSEGYVGELPRIGDLPALPQEVRNLLGRPREPEEWRPGTPLAELLENPPAKGGRNEWLAKVAGHYARTFTDFATYRKHVEWACTRFDGDLDPDEVSRLVVSIWTTEMAKSDPETVDREVEEQVRRLEIQDRARRLYRERTEPEPAPWDEGNVDEWADADGELDRIAELMPADGSTMLVAAAGSGKTTMIGNYARALTTGEPMLGRFEVVEPLTGRFGILSYEMSKKRFGSWLRKQGVPGERVRLNNLKGRANPLTTERGRLRLAEWVTDHQIECLAIDSFSRAFDGDNQNDIAQVMGFLTGLEEWATPLGVRNLIVITHAGRERERSRGSTGLDDWADVNLLLTKNDKGVHTISNVKTRLDDADWTKYTLEFDPETYLVTATESDLERDMRQNDEERRRWEILRHVQQNPGQSKTAIRKAVGGRTTDTGRLIDAMADDGPLERKDGKFYARFNGPPKG